MKDILQKIKNIQSDNCVTLILNTYRTHPDNAKDDITLKNLCKEAEQRLLEQEEKRTAKALIERIEALAEEIDHQQNLESLVLFVNEDIAEYTRLPIAVEDRVVIDQTFATRDLVRALRQEAHYFVLVLSQQKARLLEAFNDKVVQEYKGDFPIENTQFYSSSQPERSNATRQNHLMAEFFNRIDKAVNQVRHTNPLPVLICSEQSNYSEYIKVADDKSSLFEVFLHKNRLEEEAHHIVESAWEVVHEHLVAQNNNRKQALSQAVSNGKFLSDLNEIYRAIQAGRVQTLFLEEGLFQPGIMTEHDIQLVPETERTAKAVTDDVYDELIEANLNHGGDTVFLPEGELADFAGFGAITRY